MNMKMEGPIRLKEGMALGVPVLDMVLLTEGVVQLLVEVHLWAQDIH